MVFLYYQIFKVFYSPHQQQQQQMIDDEIIKNKKIKKNKVCGAAVEEFN